MVVCCGYDMGYEGTAHSVLGTTIGKVDSNWERDERKHITFIVTHSLS